MSEENKLRFVRKPEEDEPHETYNRHAWFDTERNRITLIGDDKDPNTYIRHTEMHLLFTDQAEYYVVCNDCYWTYRDMQWSGSTHNRNWRNESREYLLEHIKTKGWCQFCDPCFGNGGWI